MRSPSTSTREQPLLTATRKSPRGREDPVQPKINELKKKRLHACGTAGPPEDCAHLCASPGALLCVPVSAGAYLPRERELARLGTLGVGPTMRMHRPMRIMLVGTAPMRTLRVTTTCSDCLQAPDSYPAKLEKPPP